MGQAKLRGTREQRVAEGIAKRLKREAEMEAERARRWRNMTPAQRRKQLELASILAIAAGMNGTPDHG